MTFNQQAKDHIRLYRGGVMATTFMLIMIPVQITFFLIWPHPSSIVEWFALFNEHWWLGLISLDFLYMLSMIASVFLYIALFFAFYEGQKALSLWAFILGLLGLAVYFPSNTSLEMLSLSQQFLKASTEQEKNILIASAQTLLSIWKGTSYSVYYVLNGCALILFFLAMMRHHQFRKSTSYFGLTAGILMTVPATAGVPGMTMALLSLLPWSIFSLLVIQDFNSIIKQLKQEISQPIGV